MLSGLKPMQDEKVINIRLSKIIFVICFKFEKIVSIIFPAYKLQAKDNIGKGH